MKLIKEFLLLDLADYENIGIDLPIGAILLGFCAVMIVFSFYYYYYRSTVSCICTRLLRAGAISEESGRNLKDLRLDGSVGVKIALRGGGELGAIVKRVGEKKQTYEEYISESNKRGYKPERVDLSTAMFYIDPEKRDRAEGISSENHSVLTPIIISAVLIIVLVAAVLFLPDLLSLINKSL